MYVLYGMFYAASKMIGATVRTVRSFWLGLV